MHSSRLNSRLLGRRTKGRMQVKVSTRRLRQSVPIQHLPTALGLAFYKKKGQVIFTDRSKVRQGSLSWDLAVYSISLVTTPFRPQPLMLSCRLRID